MNAFEKEVSDLFPIIRKKTGAYLFFLYPPMRCMGTRGSMPVFIQSGPALFDAAGWVPSKAIAAHEKWDFDTWNTVPSFNKFVGIELKDTKQRHSSIRIVGADGSGSGIQAHQLESLAAVHRDSGIARLVWRNGGVVGVLDGAELAHAWYTYGVSLEVEKMRKLPAKGARSIPWSLFREIDLYESPESMLFAPLKEPTLKQSLAAKRKKADRLVARAEREKAEKRDNNGFSPEPNEGEDDEVFD